ncbi:MAG: hypothetical protein JW896_03575 [Deltaproteobacteria bacterium]|nr:hypothetical protein [Deltaproteobacteria bacterium]
MTDLTLSEYDGFSDRELKDILLEEKRKMYGAECVRMGIAPNKISAFMEVLLKSVVGWTTKMKEFQRKLCNKSERR